MVAKILGIMEFRVGWHREEGKLLMSANDPLQTLRYSPAGLNCSSSSVRKKLCVDPPSFSQRWSDGVCGSFAACSGLDRPSSWSANSSRAEKKTEKLPVILDSAKRTRRRSARSSP